MLILGDEVAIQQRILSGVVLRQQRVGCVGHVVKPAFIVFDLDAQFTDVETDLVKIPTFRRTYKIPRGELPQLAFQVTFFEFTHGLCNLTQ